MKKLFINIALISMLTTSQTSFAELTQTPQKAESSIEKIVIFSSPELANFEIYSEKNSARAIENLMNIMTLNIEKNAEGIEKNAKI